MASFSLKKRCLLALCAVLGSLSVHATDGVPTFSKDIPILIDAQSSEFDYQTKQLVFRGLRLDQGTLGVEADLAETGNLNFADGVWVFKGNVVVEADNAVLYCDEAHLTFINHQLARAKLLGQPARFEQSSTETDQVNVGEGNSIEYALTEGTLKLTENAQFFDGKNTISGDLITYDLVAQHLKAGSGGKGPVKIVIESPSSLRKDIEQKK